MRLERATYRGREGDFPDIIDNFLYISEHTEIRERERWEMLVERLTLREGPVLVGLSH